jgi:acyl-CoA hydrolase
LPGRARVVIIPAVQDSSSPWVSRYASKVRSAPEAVRKVRPGTRILLGSGAAEPATLVEALVSDAGDHLAGNEIVHLLTLGPAPYVEERFEKRFRHRAFFIGTNVRRAVQEGRADFVPIFLSEIPALLRSDRGRVDVAMIQVSPPDRRGFVSLGVSVDIVRAGVDSARMVIAEVNPRMPRTHGDSFLHVDAIDVLVPVDRDLSELPHGELDDVATAIGKHVAALVPDRATLQLGIGSVPDAVLAALGGHRDLGVHTEMFSDNVVSLVETGVITNTAKTINAGKLVTSFVMGSRGLYDWVDDNPLVLMRASDYTNDPRVVGKHDRMVSINSALSVDLTGQIAADSIGSRLFSGIGGQVDFVRGAVASKGGHAIIALPSTAKGGSLSRIVAQLPAGSGVVTSRGDVRFVATEYGVAELWGRSVRERAEALIRIAHPEHREELARAAFDTMRLRITL